MSTFKEYIIECIEEYKDVSVELKHLDSVTFEDICMLIHLITTQDKEISSNSASYCLPYLYNKNTMLMCEAHNKEELLILKFLSCKYMHKAKYIDLVLRKEKYIMSPKFVEMARCCGVYHYHITKNIISIFKIIYDTEEANSYLEYYKGNHKKSARNI